MSRVYEALKKAERQRLLKNEEAELPGYTGPELRVLSTGPQIEAESSNHETRQLAPISDQLVPGERSPIPILSRGSAIESERAEHAPMLDWMQSSRGPLLVVGRDEHSVLAEHFHLLGQNLQKWATENDKRIFTVTSALSEDGKSFVALNLAASLAMSGCRAVLVDGDLRRPVLHHTFNTPLTCGLIDYLREELEFGESLLQPTPFPGLQLVTAGGTSQAPVELLASPRMRRFIAQVRLLSPQHYVIIDSPAASLVPEPQILTRLGDAALVVVAANRTPRELVRQTLSNLAGTVFGVVLNRFEPPYSASHHYGYRYHEQRAAASGSA